METSCGIILYKVNDEGAYEFFMCQPKMPQIYRQQKWSFPKGHIEEGETPLECAKREFYEETHVKLHDSTPLIHLGKIQQNQFKQVHVFCKKYDGENMDNCYSNECVTSVDGMPIVHREVEAYAWLTYDKYESMGLSCYLPILRQIIEHDTNH